MEAATARTAYAKAEAALSCRGARPHRRCQMVERGSMSRSRDHSDDFIVGYCSKKP